MLAFFAKFVSGVCVISFHKTTGDYWKRNCKIFNWKIPFVTL